MDLADFLRATTHQATAIGRIHMDQVTLGVAQHHGIQVLGLGQMGITTMLLSNLECLIGSSSTRRVCNQYRGRCVARTESSWVGLSG